MRVKPLAMPFDAELALPGSKSHANRALIAACLADGHSTIHNATPCEDVEWMVENLRRMGFAISWLNRDEGIVEVEGGLPRPTVDTTLDCGNAGTTLRFLTALCSLVPGVWTLTGTPRMQERPIGALIDSLRSLGVEIKDHSGFPPLTIHGATLLGGQVLLDGSISSQFLSSLLLVSAAVPGGIDVEVRGGLASSPYLELTKEVMADFGVSRTGDHYGSRDDYTIEGDWSAMGAFLVLAEITGSRVRGTN